MAIQAGYDVGGAHLKVAVVEDGRVLAARQIACPLWQGLDRLDAALSEAAAVTARAASHAVTMTAELCEVFPSREAGVVTLTRHLAGALGANVSFFMGLKGFGDAGAAEDDTCSVASANFLATARAIALRRPKALLIDMGSTTTDIIACDRPLGLTDAERLQTGELVYTGLTRTPVASVATRAPLAGQWQTLARDTFATLADVRRILDELPDGLDDHATADSRGKSVAESLARFARGFGRDADERHIAIWRTAAAYICERQLRSIYDGAIQVMSRPNLEFAGGVISAGIGAPAAGVVAQRLGLAATPFGDLVGASGDTALKATHCAPAVAVALLAAHK